MARTGPVFFCGFTAQNLTLVAGHLATGADPTALLVLYNPDEGGPRRLLLVRRTIWSFTSGTPSAEGPCRYYGADNCAITATRNNGGVPDAAPASLYLQPVLPVEPVARIFTNTPVTGLQAQTERRKATLSLTAGAIGANTRIVEQVDDINDEISLSPGSALQLVPMGSGPVATVSIVWREVAF